MKKSLEREGPKSLEGWLLSSKPRKVIPSTFFVGLLPCKDTLQLNRRRGKRGAGAGPGRAPAGLFFRRRPPAHHVRSCAKDYAVSRSRENTDSDAAGGLLAQWQLSLRLPSVLHLRKLLSGPLLPGHGAPEPRGQLRGLAAKHLDQGLQLPVRPRM